MAPFLLEKTLKHWTDYWCSKEISCLPGKANEELNNLINSQWKLFGTRFCESDGLAILDLACGSGMVSHILADTLKYDAYFNCLDAGKVSFSLPQRHKLNLLSEFIINEKSQLEKKFDLIVSNFGAEYIKENDILEFISNHINSDGYIALNLHYEQSIITEISKQVSNAISAWTSNQRLQSLENKLNTNFSIADAKSYIDILLQLNIQNAEVANSGLASDIVNMMSSYQKGNLDKLEFDSIRNTYINYQNRLNQQIESATNAARLISEIKISPYFEVITLEQLTISEQNISTFIIFKPAINI